MLLVFSSVYSMPKSFLERGSLWHKWDLHTHGPSSALNNQFPKQSDGSPDWEKYLEAEEDDHRPLIIDQTDDNLDNLSIFPSLVHYFRERKRTRQIVIITHNPNLVVTTDSEQIVISGFDGARAPRVQYRSGALENTSPGPDEGIREEVCHILEGGIDAFRIREHRYDLPE
jgi:hypothetical protein